jgi:hypothetical protein
MDFKPKLERHEKSILEEARKGELISGANLSTARLSMIARSVSALMSLQTLTLEQFTC